MPLSNDLISQFVKITKDETKAKPETSTYGTVVGELDGRATIRLDGSDLITPASKTADVRSGDRVTVMIKNHTAIITGNLSSPAARIADLMQAGVDIATFEARVDTLEANTLTAEQIEAVNVVTEKLDAGIVTTEELSAVEVRVDNLEADMLTAENADLKYAKIADMDAANAEIDTLSSTFADFQTATAKDFEAINADIQNLDTIYATISALDTEKARIDDLEAGSAEINTLIFGSATGTTIQTSFANAVIAQLGDAQIKSAMIDSIAAGKITSGDIITNNVRVKSEDGSLIISDETMQISDGTRVRVQIGKDAASDYSINIWDADGNLMFSKGGITDSAIKEAIIRNDMVSETANIAASKLDIDSLFEEINGSTNTIKSTKVYLDDEGQTLDVAFKALETTVTSQGETITSQGTAISTIQGQITSKVWQQDIDTATNAMSTQYSTLEQSLNSYKTTVGETYATKVDLTDLEIGGRNLVQNSSFTDGTSKWQVSTNTMSVVDGYTGNGLQIVVTTSATVTPRQSMPLTLKAGDKLTGSAKVKVVEGDFSGYSMRFANALTLDCIDVRPIDDEWSLYIYQVTVESDTTIGSSNVFGFAYGAAGTYIIDDLKLERGDKATDWTPAPEDVDADISALDTRVSSAESSITLLSDRITANVTETTNLGTRMSTVEQTADGLTLRLDTTDSNVSTAQSTANTANTNALNAAKTATNYLDLSSNGLVVGDLTASTLGRNVLIDSDSVDIRNGTTVLASYGDTLIEIGKNSSEAIISLCGDKGQIEFDSDENYFQITSDYLRLKGNSAASLYSNYYNNESFGQRSAINVGPGSIYMYSQESSNIDPSTQVGVWTTSTLTFDPTRFDLLTDSISEISRYGSTYSAISGNMTLEASGVVHSKSTLIVSSEEKTGHNDGATGWYIGTDGTAHTTNASGGGLIAFHYKGSEAYTSIIRETSSGVISINGFEYAADKVLWSGSYYMSASQTITLSEAISEQATGIVLVFSRYSSSTAQNYHFNTHFVPKAQISRHHGCGHVFLLSSDGSFGLFAAKYLYIHDATIVGNDVNTSSGTGTCGIKYTNGGYVLRYVIGV